MKDRITIVRSLRAPLALAFAAALALSACGGAPPATPAAAPEPTQTTAAEASKTEPAAAGEAPVDKSKLSAELSLYNWAEYIAPEVVQKFEEEYGVKVIIDSYDDNESMFAKFQAGGNPGYDLVVPTDYMIEKMIKADMLEKIDFANVPNIKNIDPAHLNLYFDPDQEYNAPYFWGTTGIAYDTARIKRDITSWRDIFEPADEIKGKIGLLSDQRETIGAALRYLGYSANATDPQQIEQAKQLLLEHKQYVQGYTDSIAARDNLIAGDAAVIMSYPGDTLVARQQKPSIRYVIPADGATLWQDGLVIPKGAQSKYTAEAFINFMLRPDISAMNANLMGYPTPNAESIKQGLVDQTLAEDKTMYPDVKAYGDKLEFLKRFEGDVQDLYDRAWTEVGAGQ